MIDKIIIAYHKDCMDGVSSAYIVHTGLVAFGFFNIGLVPIQYGKEDALNAIDMTHNTVIIFADFSLKRAQMLELALRVKEIQVYDHHKTAKAELVDLPENITTVFDMDKSGAMICYEQYHNYWKNKDSTLFQYIQDRDLWQWKLPNSKEISAYLRLIVKPNDIRSFNQVYESFNIDDACMIGSNLLKYQNNQVMSKLNKTKDITLDGISMKAVNITENISELGNEICNTFNCPALMYFITEDSKVVCSLRSMDTLPDVSIIATKFGGGGHRNACGFTTTLERLIEILN